MSHFVLKSQKLSRLSFTRRIFILFLLLMLCGTVSAYTYYRPSDSPYGNRTSGMAIPPGTQLPSYQITSTSSIEMGSGYVPGIISPFSNGNPSNNTGSGSGDGGSSDDDIVFDENDFVDNEDPNFVPVGEPWIMLILAMMLSAVIFLKQRKRIEMKD